MSSHKKKAEEKAIEQLQKHNALLSVNEYVVGIVNGNRAILSSAITLVESNADIHRTLSSEIISGCIAHAGK